MRIRKDASLIAVLFIFSLVRPVLGAITPEQEMRSREIEQKQEKLRQRIETPRKAPEVKEEELIPSTILDLEISERVLIKKINVTDATLISQKEIDSIILPLENKEYAFNDLQKIVDWITDAYRKKGYVSSQAYLPPQKIEQGILQVKVIEAVTGNIAIRGNRYFKGPLLRKKIALKKGEHFNYNILKKGLNKINEQRDRSARATLMAGKEPGTTDVDVEVKDRLPIHIGFGWDNLGSRYIGKERYTFSFEHNNLLGFDDKLSFEYQLAQTSRYFLKNIEYLFPISDWEVGLMAAFSRVKLGRELEDLDVRGKSQLYGLFLNRSLISADNTELTMRLGFDYKDITNYQLQTVSSADRLRVLKTGFDMDVSDKLGRTLFTYELNYAIPGIMGGLKKPADTTTASRSGAGGEFIKNTINLLRLQSLPFASTLLWKTQIQLSPYILPSSEQFQIGGLANVRGYPSAEAGGDSGYAMTWEWICPIYFVPKQIKVPFSKAKLYDALRLALFYDWANTRLRRPSVASSSTEEKNKTLRGFGCGLRFNLPEDLTFKIDFAWPLDNLPSDGNHLHTLVQFSKKF